MASAPVQSTLLRASVRHDGPYERSFEQETALLRSSVRHDGPYELTFEEEAAAPPPAPALSRVSMRHDGPYEHGFEDEAAPRLPALAIGQARESPNTAEMIIQQVSHRLSSLSSEITDQISMRMSSTAPSEASFTGGRTDVAAPGSPPRVLLAASQPIDSPTSPDLDTGSGRHEKGKATLPGRSSTSSPSSNAATFAMGVDPKVEA